MRSARTKETVNAAINEILIDGDQKNDNSSATRSTANPADCEGSDNTMRETSRQCSCGVENSFRFSLRVMEAMRSLQRDVDQPSTSSAEDIVDYIRANYNNDGDLYAQVRTTLRQVCCQGFVIKLCNNEYHLVGPVARSKKPNGSNSDRIICTSMMTDEMSNRSISNHPNGCLCKRISRLPTVQSSQRNPRSSSLETCIAEHRIAAGPSTTNERTSANGIVNPDKDTDSEGSSCICESLPDNRNDPRQRRDVTTEIKQRDGFPSLKPGPSREIVRTPKNARKKIRLEDRTVERACENDSDRIYTAQDRDVGQRGGKRLADRAGVAIKIRRNDQRHVTAEEDEDEDEDEEKEEGEDEEKEEDADTKDRQSRKQSPCRRNKTRERELKRWIRRCREECDRRRKAR